MTRARVNASHCAPERAPVRITSGQRVRLGERDTDWTEFVWTVLDNDAGGWVPHQLLGADGNGHGIALAGYDTTELDAEPGELLDVGTALAGWHWARNARGREGWIPARNIELIEGHSP